MIGTMFRERARARAVAKLTVRRASDPGCQRFVEQASNAFAASTALVTLIRSKQLLVYASKGLPLTDCAREQSFCAHAIGRAGDIYEVCDAAADPTFRTLPGVEGDPHIRYYIGAPLVLQNGVEVGTLCVLDTRARPPASADQRAYLASLARQTAAALERSVDGREAIAS